MTTPSFCSLIRLKYTTFMDGNLHTRQKIASGNVWVNYETNYETKLHVFDRKIHCFQDLKMIFWQVEGNECSGGKPDMLLFTRTFLWADFMLAWKSACMNVRRERHFMSKNEHCVLQTHLKQRRALKARFCEWRGVNSNPDIEICRYKFSA